jgi:hypothetical protein
VQVDVDDNRAGAGRELYTQLLRRLTERSSILQVPGRRPKPTRRTEAHCWHDVAWMQLDLPDTADPDLQPTRFINRGRRHPGR